MSFFYFEYDRVALTNLLSILMWSLVVTFLSRFWVKNDCNWELDVIYNFWNKRERVREEGHKSGADCIILFKSIQVNGNDPYLKKFYSNKIELKKGNLPNKYYFAQVMVGWFRRVFMIKMWKRNMLCCSVSQTHCSYNIHCTIFLLHITS